MPSRSSLCNYLIDSIQRMFERKIRCIDCSPYTFNFFISIMFSRMEYFLYAPRICLSQMATTKCVFIVFVLSLVISTVLCQTFQYSRGWTNGKRSEFSNSLGISNPGDEHFTNGEFKRLKMLVYGNVDEQVSF